MCSPKFLLFVTLAFLASQLEGQVDSHYWTHQYGAKGLLLNGAVIASAEGETSLFYNPGSMGMDDNLGFAFSFLSPTYSNLTTTNFIGDGNVITDTGLGFSPGFLGIRFKPFKNDKIVMGVTAFERFKTDIKFEDRVVSDVSGSPLLLFRGDLFFSRRISEDWYGIGLSMKVTDNIGIGLTHFSIWNSQSLDFNLKKEILPKSNPTNVFLGWHRELGFDFSVSAGFVSKLGISIRQPNFNLGMTFTTPTYGIIEKSGKYYTDDYRVNSTINLSENSSNRNSVSLQALKSPYSIGFGFDFTAGKNVISFSSEYFGSLAEHTIFNDVDDSFDGIGSEVSNTSINLSSEKKSVFNVAVGLMHKSSERTTYVWGLRTDFDEGSSLVFNDATEYIGTIGDVFHLSGGGMFNFGKNQFSLGMDVAYNRQDKGRQLIDITAIQQDNFFTFTEKNNASTRFYSFMVFITYDFIFTTISSE